MQDPSYVSVYVPASGADYQHHSSPSVKRTSIRRFWNRLSRLQKSFLLMTFMILVVFSLFMGTLTWIPPNSDNGLSGRLKEDVRVDISFRESVVADPVKSKRVTSNPYLYSQQPPKEFEPDIAKSQWQLPKSSAVPTIPRALQPDFGDSNSNLRLGGISNQAAENIRSMISLDPVIPLSIARKSKPSRAPASSVIKSLRPDAMRLKFNGPENPRQKEVVAAFLHAWHGYKAFSWGQDHLKPISGGGHDWFGLGLTLVDSLDTMFIMGLQNEFFEARDWVESSLSFDINKNVNLFETTIRVLGGLLSAYHLSGDQMFLAKAQELGSILLVGFKSPSGVPYSDINLKKKTAHGPSWNPDSTTSEVSTVQLEFRDLSRSTNIPSFEMTSMNVSIHIHSLPKLEGLVGIHISPSTGLFRAHSVITLGARGDSYYEYLLKQWIQTGKTIDFLRDDYLLAVEGMRNRLLQRTTVSNLTFLGELDNNGNVFRPKMDELVCFLPGTLALGVSHGFPNWHLEFAKSLLYTCYLTYKNQPTGLAPEITYYKTEADAETDFFVKSNDAHNLLRPETVESLWYLYQITGDKMYQDWGWQIFQSFMKYTRVQNGFTSIGSVLNPENTRPRDMMESFFLGETLKYFYLLFSDKPIFDLNFWVFNTEAHPLPIRDH